MYKMTKCPKCGSENIYKGSMAGALPEFYLGIPNGLAGCITYTCNECGYTEFVAKLDDDKDKKNK